MFRKHLPATSRRPLPKALHPTRTSHRHTVTSFLHLTVIILLFETCKIRPRATFQRYRPVALYLRLMAGLHLAAELRRTAPTCLHPTVTSSLHLTVTSYPLHIAPVHPVHPDRLPPGTVSPALAQVRDGHLPPTIPSRSRPASSSIAYLHPGRERHRRLTRQGPVRGSGIDGETTSRRMGTLFMHHLIFLTPLNLMVIRVLKRDTRIMKENS